MDKKTKIADLPDFDLAEHLKSKKKYCILGYYSRKVKGRFDPFSSPGFEIG